MKMIARIFKAICRWCSIRSERYTHTSYSVNGKEMTGEQKKHFDAAFDKLDEGFKEVKKIFKEK